MSFCLVCCERPCMCADLPEIVFRPFEVNRAVVPRCDTHVLSDGPRDTSPSLYDLLSDGPTQAEEDNYPSYYGDPI